MATTTVVYKRRVSHLAHAAVGLYETYARGISQTVAGHVSFRHSAMPLLPRGQRINGRNVSTQNVGENPSVDANTQTKTEG